MDKKDLSKYARKIIPQLLIQSIAVIITAIYALMFMTWLTKDVFGVSDTYRAAGYQSIGTLVIMIVVLVPINTALYRRRLKEVTILSEGIQKIANGDFDSKIISSKKEPLYQVYEDFNKMCDELKSVQILRNDFINSYSHEFKTPIASINGFASLLLEKDFSSEEQQEYLKIIIEESARLSKLASNTVLLSKLSSQQIVTDTERFDLGEQLKQCSIILSQEWLDKKIEFEGDFNAVFFVGNKELTQHLWLNILSNAIKYTPVGGEINVKVFKDDNNAVVKISDTGVGMNENTKKHLFDPYYQGDTSHSSQGLGLGLAISKRIVELNNGTISVKSKLSIGSEFTVTLPLN